MILKQVPLAGLIDVEAERARLGKEVALRKRFTNSPELSNEAFVSVSPAEVVEKERQRAKDLEASLTTLAEQLQQLAELA